MLIGWPVGPGNDKMNLSDPQGDALGWQNCRAFGPPSSCVLYHRIEPVAVDSSATSNPCDRSESAASANVTKLRKGRTPGRPSWRIARAAQIEGSAGMFSASCGAT